MQIALVKLTFRPLKPTPDKETNDVIIITIIIIITMAKGQPNVIAIDRNYMNEFSHIDGSDGGDGRARVQFAQRGQQATTATTTWPLR